MDILFVAGFGPIVRDPASALDLYANVLGIEFDHDGGYASTGSLEGVKHFGLWPLSHAAQSCFGTDTWPTDVPAPSAYLELEIALDQLDTAAAEVEAADHTFLRLPADEPWGQRTARLLSADGLLVGLVHTPWLH